MDAENNNNPNSNIFIIQDTISLDWLYILLLF